MTDIILAIMLGACLLQGLVHLYLFIKIVIPAQIELDSGQFPEDFPPNPSQNKPQMGDDLLQELFERTRAKQDHPSNT